MPRSILVPIDGSSLSETALPVAIAIARQQGDTAVEAITVAPPATYGFSGSGAPAIDTSLDHDLRAELRGQVSQLEARLAAMAPELTTHVTLVDGPIAESIATFAEHGQHQLVVMTTHGRSGMSRLWLGSVADRLVRICRVPLLLLKDQGDAPPATGTPLFRDVLIPIDVETRSDDIVADVLAMTGHATTLHLLHVVVPQRRMPPPALDLLGEGRGIPDARQDLLAISRVSAEQHLASLAERLSARGLHVTTQVRTHHSPAQAILEAAAERHAALICMASHGRGPLGRVLLGSVTDKVIRGAPVPVLVRVSPSKD
jgi:nucleotide-binding universal stress UspA family protein